MPFNSYEFIFGFLPVTVGGFWLLARFVGRATALGWLLLASVAFYAYASATSLAILAPSVALDYVLASAMVRSDLSRKRLRMALFVTGVVVNVLFLGYFKYMNFFLDNVNTLFATHFELTRLILPLGISFITFQKVAFLADVKSGQVKAVRVFDFLLFTLFFPRAVAGPIVHYDEVMPQFTDIAPRKFMTNAAVAICLFSIGLFKKSVIADGVGQFVPPTFDDAPLGQALDLLTAWTGVLAYTFQLYFDFSGYSDMALGLARIFGVRLTMNFNSPLKASSVIEFWSRWHITLTRFLTAYVYTPIVLSLTRSRIARGKSVLRGKRSTLSAIAVLVGVPTLITMGISGFWHGAGWQFVVWGVLHGIYLTVNQAWRIIYRRFWPDQTSYQRVMKPLGFVLTFGGVVTAFVFFRATSIASALSILGGMIGMNEILSNDFMLLLKIGLSSDWSILWGLSAPFRWIIVLFVAVTWLPNSLELLRRFQPALDFPERLEEAKGPESVPSMMIKQSAGMKRLPGLRTFRLTWGGVTRLGHEGISLSRLTATIVALLWVLGIVALSHSDGFLYWKF